MKNNDNGHSKTAPTLMNREERYLLGKQIRTKVSRKSHGEWKPPSNRPDPIRLLVESSKGRLPELIPIRYGRMMQTPFTFYRGAAAIMAADLASTPTSGIRVQACGDCHLLNFGMFGTPERQLNFDINDFDETLPAPWEWDVKRLAASFAIASRNNKFSKEDCNEAVLRCMSSYREHIAEYSNMKVLDRWYAKIQLQQIMDLFKDREGKKRLQGRIQKAAARNVIDEDFPKLADVTNGNVQIKDNPPLIYHVAKANSVEFKNVIHNAFQNYQRSLPVDRRMLLDHYQIKDFAMKVVGVGSVGTRCGILLLMAADNDPLFLQVKEARVSVLEPYAGKSIFDNRGQRVVEGQRLMQSASDMFLGWTEGRKGRHFYIRQLRDMKIKPLVEIFNEELMFGYAHLCGWALARAHARSGDPAMISGYIGSNETFDEAIAKFSFSYAEQNDQDHTALLKAIRAGKLEAYREQ